MTTMRRAWSIAALVLTTALACTSGPPPVPRGRLAPVFRLIDGTPSPMPAGVLWRGYTKLAGEERLVIGGSSSETETVTATPPPSDAASATWSVAIPDRFRQSAWLVVRPIITSAGNVVTLPSARLVPMADLGSTLPIDVAGDVRRDTDSTRVLAALAPTAALDARDMVGAPFAVPPGAVLTVGVGVEESAWTIDACAVEFRVGVVERDRETIVHRTVLDPVRRSEDRRWVDVRVDLGAFAGRTVALRLSTAPADPTARGTSLPVWADPVVLAPGTAERPNVVLVSLDTLRAKSVTTYGSPRPTMPYLDALVADEGTVFDHAYTTAPHTLPAHLSTFTSLYVRSYGEMGPLGRLPDQIATLPERMREAGYDTGAVTEDGFIVPSVGFRRGFATYRENTSPHLHEPLGQSAKTFRDAIDWLAPRRDHPTFLFAHTYEVHYPYTPAPPYDVAFASAAELNDPLALDLLRYEQEARHLDDELRAFLDAIDALDLGRRTLVVVMADHGEEFGEHGQRRHGLQVYDESIHVPLMMRFPGIVPAGLRIATPVSLVDVAPTILDLVGAPPLIGADGESLVPLFGGGSLSAHRHAVFSEATSSLRTTIDLLSVHLPDVHCIYRTRSGTSECYDDAVDPNERHRLESGGPAVDDARSQAVAYWSLRHTPPAPTAPSELVHELSKGDDAARLEKLRALGYAE